MQIQITKDNYVFVRSGWGQKWILLDIKSEESFYNKAKESLKEFEIYQREHYMIIKELTFQQFSETLIFLGTIL